MRLGDLYNTVSWKKGSVNAVPMTAERIVVINRIELCFAAVVGLGVIAAAGVGIGILFAPNSGVETRKNIKNKAVTTVEAIMSIARKKSKTVKDSAAQATQDVVSDVSSVLTGVHRKTDGVKKDVQDDFYHIARDIHETTKTMLND